MNPIGRKKVSNLGVDGHISLERMARKATLKAATVKGSHFKKRLEEVIRRNEEEELSEVILPRKLGSNHILNLPRGVHVRDKYTGIIPAVHNPRMALELGSEVKWRDRPLEFPLSLDQPHPEDFPGWTQLAALAKPLMIPTGPKETGGLVLTLQDRKELKWLAGLNFLDGISLSRGNSAISGTSLRKTEKILPASPPPPPPTRSKSRRISRAGISTKSSMKLSYPKPKN